MTTSRLGFSHWSEDDLPLARMLWSNSEVTRYICAHGAFTEEEITAKLENEILNLQKYGTQYFPIFKLSTDEFIGCCGVHFFDGRFELGYHLLPEFWGEGYATEAAKAAMEYFSRRESETLYAGHHPDNAVSAHILKKLGFEQVRTVFYEPTGLYHPLYTKNAGR